MSKMVVLYKRFERFWHWSQVLLVLVLILTGLEIHGYLNLYGFANAIAIHNLAGFLWTILILLVFTWILTSSEVKQWKPTTKGVAETARFYLYGVFLGEEHPHHPTPKNKFNPLQRLAYIGIVFGLIPMQLVSGICFYFFPELRDMGYIAQLDVIAAVHTLGAYIIMAFLVMHIYLTTFGKKLTSHIVAMITGKEEI